jgi:hypothetical protein
MKKWILAVSLAVSMAALWSHLAAGEGSGEFPVGFDAVQAAPASHRVIFENQWVRVLEVRIPAAGATEPMHHHRWPGFFIEWDTGGRSPHVRYHTPDGRVRDIPSRAQPSHPGRWEIHWMKPEPMHAIEVVERYGSACTQQPPLLRVELKTAP